MHVSSAAVFDMRDASLPFKSCHGLVIQAPLRVVCLRALAPLRPTPLMRACSAPTSLVGFTPASQFKSFSLTLTAYPTSDLSTAPFEALRLVHGVWLHARRFPLARGAPRPSRLATTESFWFVLETTCLFFRLVETLHTLKGGEGRSETQDSDSRSRFALPSRLVVYGLSLYPRAGNTHSQPGML